MIARILCRRMSDEGKEHLPPVEGQRTSAFLSSLDTKGGGGEKVASASATAGATTKEGGESGAKRLNTEVQDGEAEVRAREEEASEKEVVYCPEKARLSSEHIEASPKIPLIIPGTSRQQDKQSATLKHQTEPQTNRAAPEIQDTERQLREKERHLQIREAEVQYVEKVLREKERDLQIREAEVQDGEKVLRMKERDLQIRGQDAEKSLGVKERDLQTREAEVQKMFQAVNERREAMDLQEDNLRQRSAAMKELEDNLRLREAALAQQLVIVGQPTGAAQESDLLSLSSFSSIQNSPRMRSNVGLPPKSNAKLKHDSRYHGNELVSLASTTKGGPSKHTDIGFSSSKSHAGSKEDSEYYSNE